MKRIFTCATLLTLLILVLTACSFNLDKNPQELTFYPKDDGTYAVAMGNAKLLSEITIPATYKGKAVTEIADHGFDGSVAQRIVIPDSVTSIGDYAFSYCSALESITIPNGVTSIGKYAFYNCTSLTDINYRGNSTQWEAISKGYRWDGNTGAYSINYNYEGK